MKERVVLPNVLNFGRSNFNRVALPEERLGHLIQKKAVLDRHADQFLGAALGGISASSLGGLLFRRPIEGVLGVVFSEVIGIVGLYFEGRANEVKSQIEAEKTYLPG